MRGIYNLDRHDNAVGRVAAYLRGAAESSGGCGMTYDNDPYSPRSVAYDVGRNHGSGVRSLRFRAVQSLMTWGADK